MHGDIHTNRQPRSTNDNASCCYHPLDHPPGSLRCRQLPGALRHHLHLAWRYRWGPKLRAATACRLGSHRWVEGWTMDTGKCQLCADCWIVRR